MRRILTCCGILMMAAAAPAADAQAEHGTMTAADEIVRVGEPGAKETAPVDVQITALPEPGPGRRRVRIVAVPTVDAPSVTIEVAAEDGLALGEGAEVAWSAPARAGEEIVRELELAVTGPGERRLVVAATVKFDDASSQTGLHTYAFNRAAGAEEALTRSLRSLVRTDPSGRNILEIPAATP